MRRALFAAAGLSMAAQAQMPVPRLDQVFPAGGKSGTEVEITLAGPDLADLTTVIFDTPGVTATKFEGAKFRVKIAEDCRRGLYELRAVGKNGISSPKTFVVGEAPETIDPGSNHKIESAVVLAIPGVVHGRFDAEKRDYYKLALKMGETVAITCHSCALDSPADPVVVISNSAGKTLARGDDQRDRDAVLTFVAPANGEYIIAVHDKLFAGGAAHLYRLALDEAPLPLRDPASGVGFVSGETKSISEQEPNDTATTSQQIQLPAEVRGNLDTDWFAFQGEAGKALWIDVVAARANQEADPYVVIQKVTRDAQGADQSKQVLELDDIGDFPAPPRWQAGSADASGKFVPDETTTYRLRVSDRFASRAPYSLIVREAAPDFAVIALPESPLDEANKHFVWQPQLRRGGGASLRLGVYRRGYDGQIVLRAEGLPEGVIATGGIPAGSATGTLVFHADANAKPWADFVHVVAEGGGVTREVKGLTYRWTVGNRDNERLASRLCRIALGIADQPAPMSIVPAEPREYEGVIGQTLEVPLKLARNAPLAQPKGEWQLSPFGFPGLAKFDPLKIDGASANEAKLVINLLNKDGNSFAPGTYTFHLQARGTVAWKPDEKAGAKDGKHVDFSGPITVKLVEAPAATAAVKQ